MKEGKVHHYESPDAKVTWDAIRCIHAAECVRTLPPVFDPAAKPWIRPDKADAASVADAVNRCPSGALRMQFADGTSAMAVPPDNHGRVTANGPNYLRGKLRLREGESVLEDTRVALCRCGASQHKPFCDNSHKKIGFVDAGTFPAGASAHAGADLVGAAGHQADAQRPCGLHGPAHAAWQRWAHARFPKRRSSAAAEARATSRIATGRTRKSASRARAGWHLPTMAADTADQLALLGRAFELQQAGRLPEAEALYAQVLAANPDDATALVNAGAVALARGDVALAIARSERVVRLAPRNAPARNNLGFALIRAGRDSEALAVLDQAIALNGDYAQAHNNRGIALARLGRAAESIAAFERALLLEPRYGEAALNLGNQCNSAGDGDRAAAAFERVLDAQPTHADALTGRAFARALRGDLPGAIGALETITATYPAHAPAWQTLGAVRNWAWDHAGAELAFGRALRLAPTNADAQFGIASTLLARGDYAAGWRAFERRPDRGGESGTALTQIPVWDGAPFAGTLVVFGEQGFGDVVQFARFIAPARARVGRIVLLLDGYHAPLAPLLASVDGVDQVVTRATDIRRDGTIARASILSLPFHLGIRVDHLGAVGRYLAPPADRAAAWQARMATDRRAAGGSRLVGPGARCPRLRHAPQIGAGACARAGSRRSRGFVRDVAARVRGRSRRVRRGRSAHRRCARRDRRFRRYRRAHRHARSRD